MKDLKILSLFAILLLTLGFNGCVDNDFDEPENTFQINDDQVIDISEIMDLLDAGNGKVVFDSTNVGADTYIKGTVTADDASGNFYKQIVFQDETGAMQVLADRNELNAEFPLGNTIYVKLNGLILAYNSNLPALGYYDGSNDVNRIPDPLVNDFLFAGGEGAEITPEVITLSEFAQNDEKYFNKLVQFENVEFSEAYILQPYAISDGPDGPITVNSIIMDCEDNEVILRNSGFSDFADEIVPSGNGTLTAIASVFNNDLQLFIRNTNDVSFNDERCDGSGNQAENEITIASIKNGFYSQGIDAAPEGYLKGIVVSNRVTGQLDDRNLFLQNGDDGILLRFSSFHNFSLGEEIQVTVTGRKVEEYRGVLQVNDIPLFNAISNGAGTLPTPKVLTVAEILSDNNKYEGTLVEIKNATLSGGSTYSGSIDVDDGTGVIEIFTWDDTGYANDPVPSGAVDVIAVVSQYNDTPQLMLNDSDDVKGGTVTNPGDGDVNQDFQDLQAGSVLNIPGWLNIATVGTQQWEVTEFMGDQFAECEGYQASSSNVEAWLITPAIDTDDKFNFSFETAQAYWQHAGLTVWVSPDFDNVNDAQWTEMTDAKLANESDEQFSLVSSGTIDLRDYFGGKVRVGWKYVGDDSSNTTKMRIDNVRLQ